MGLGKFVCTSIKRVTLSQELQIVLAPLGDTASVIRKVQMVIPAGEAIFAVIDPEPNNTLSSKNYNYPPVATGATVEFPLAPSQCLAMCVSTGFVTLSIIIEQYEPYT